MSEVLDALAAETIRTGDFLAALEPDDWLRPTRCPPLTVLELASHAWRGSMRVAEMLANGPVGGQPEKDAVTYFQYDAAAEAPEIAARAQEAAREHDPRELPDTWRRTWSEALSGAEAALDGDGVYQTVFGTLKLSEYLRTRVLEVTIHTMDMRDALGLGPDPTLPGLTVTCDVLRGLLGTDLRPLGIDDVRFALTGTGRNDLDDAERKTLGPLADLFPVLR